MEVYCKKEALGGTLEYKMIERHEETAELGRMKTYGLSVKYYSQDDFDYYCIENVAHKPQIVLQIIKYLFDRNTTPENAYSSIENFLNSALK